MKFDYLQSEVELPYVEPIAKTKRMPWILLGVGLFLILVIGLKVAFKQSPATASAKQQVSPVQKVETSPVNMANMSLAEIAKLSNISKEMDDLACDPFQNTSKKNIRKHMTKAPKQVKTQQQKKASPIVKLNVNLKAIVLGAKPKAFIDQTFVGEGDTFEVLEPEKMTCQVISIDEHVVKVKVGQKLHVLRLISDSEKEKSPWRF